MLWCINDDGSQNCKPLTLPRLQLQGAVLGIRLKKLIVQEMDMRFSVIKFWTDSTINLQYINNNEKRFKTFVRNRIAENRRHSEPSQWNFVSGKDNPADLATRGCAILDLCKSDLWLHGQEIIQSEVDPNLHLPTIPPDDPEVKKNVSYCELFEDQPDGHPVIDMSRYSSWKKLVNVMSWIRVYLNNLKNKDRVFTKEKRFRQLELLETKEGRSLDPFLDEDGILRVGGRLKHALLPYTSRHQIILPYRHYAVKLLIE